MVLESTMICVDSSDYMRNGDFVPTRYHAQQDAVGMVFHSKTRSNPENNCGLICSTSGEVISNLTSDAGKILSRLHDISPGGDCEFITTLKVAKLALKQRQSKNHRMRVVVFIGSPLTCAENEMTKLAKRLKKEKVSVDIVNFGEGDSNTELLSNFINVLNGRDGTDSHLVTVPTGPHLSDALISSPILQGEDGAPSAALATGSGFEFGVDPNEDPELAMALRVSMDEQRALQQQQDQQTTPDQTAADTDAQQVVPQSAQEESVVASVPDFGSMTEEEQIAYAMQMSMADQGESTPMDTDTTAQAEESSDKYMDVVSDPEFLQSVLESLPGVDPNSEEVRGAMGGQRFDHPPKEHDTDKSNKPK